MRIHAAGTGACLLDAAEGPFDEAVQSRVRGAAAWLSDRDEIRQAVCGVNNLLVTFDSRLTDPDRAENLLRTAWEHSAECDMETREHVVPVDYADGEDLEIVAAHAGLSIEEVIAIHAAGSYRVAAIGAMPGFPYLTGLDERLCLPRRATPRLSVARGAVMVGGGHAGVIPCTAPSGWHILGHTDTIFFDPDRDEPCLMRLGDVVRFRRVR